MKDFHDLLFLTKYEEKLNLEALTKVIESVFRHRGTLLELPIFFEESEIVNFQIMWKAYLTKLPYGQAFLPEHFSKVIEKINSWIMKNIFSSALEDNSRFEFADAANADVGGEQADEENGEIAADGELPRQPE